MTRSKHKLPIINHKIENHLTKQIRNSIPSKEKRIFNKVTKITPSLFEHVFAIYNGLKITKLRISPQMNGKKLGEFIYTRKTCIYKKKSKDKKK